MFGAVLILGSGVACKLIMRTKLRSPKMADLQTGRRPLTTEEIVHLDEYSKLSKWRKAYTFVRLR